MSDSSELEVVPEEKRREKKGNNIQKIVKKIPASKINRKSDVEEV